MSELATAGRKGSERTAFARLREISRDRTRSFRLIVYLSIFIFVLLYVFTVRGVEAILDNHFARVIQQATEVPDLQRPVALQIQDQIEQRIQQSAWVRIGGVRATVIVLGRDGTVIYVGGRALPPPPSVNLAALLRDAQRLLPATAEVIVSVPHNALLSNGILLVYAAALLQGLFLYHRVATRRDQRSLTRAHEARDTAFQRSREIDEELSGVRSQLEEVEPTEREHSQEVRALQFERQSLQRKLAGLASREEELRGKADATATAVYAESYDRDADFYAFTKSMETYEETMDGETVFILDTDSELLRFLDRTR